MLFGVLLCLDCFLYLFTVYPLRVLMAIGRLVASLGSGLRIGPAHVCDLVRAVLLLVSLTVVTSVDVSYVAVAMVACCYLRVVWQLLKALQLAC